MNPRSQEILQKAVEASHRCIASNQIMYDMLVPYQANKWVQGALAIIKKIDAIDKTALEIDPPTDTYIHFTIDLMKQIDQLNGCLKKWEQAVENNRGKGIMAFLEEAGSIGDDIKSALVALEKMRKEQIANNAHIHPALEPHYALQKQLLELGDLIKKLPVTQVQAYQPVVMYFNEVYKKSLGYTNYHIDLLENTKKGVGILNIDELIKQRRAKIRNMFAEFNELADIAEAEAEAEEQQAVLNQFSANTKAIRAEDQQYVEAASAIEAAVLKKVSAVVEAPVLKLGVSDSPPSSNSATPPKSGSELSSSPHEDDMQIARLSSADVSPERSPKEGEWDEKEMPMQKNQFVGLSLQPKSAAPQLPPKVAQPAKTSMPTVTPQKSVPPVQPKKGILSGLFGKSKKSKEPGNAAATSVPQQARSGAGFNQD
jgi:hypothetical protein